MPLYFFVGFIVKEVHILVLTYFFPVFCASVGEVENISFILALVALYSILYHSIILSLNNNSIAQYFYCSINYPITLSLYCIYKPLITLLSQSYNVSL